VKSREAELLISCNLINGNRHSLDLRPYCSVKRPLTSFGWAATEKTTGNDNMGPGASRSAGMGRQGKEAEGKGGDHDGAARAGQGRARQG
jgi:hypothetical protein